MREAFLSRRMLDYNFEFINEVLTVGDFGLKFPAIIPASKLLENPSRVPQSEARPSLRCCDRSRWTATGPAASGVAERM